jgi:hypothetical protein
LKGLTLSQIQILLDGDTLGEGAKDVVMFPPDDGNKTDEDSENEDTTLPKDTNSFGEAQLRQKAEVVFVSPTDLPNILRKIPKVTFNFYRDSAIRFCT